MAPKKPFEDGIERKSNAIYVGVYIGAGNERFLDEALVPGLRWRAELRTEPEGSYDDINPDYNSDPADKDQSAGYSPDDDEPAAFDDEMETRKGLPPTASQAPMDWEQLLPGGASATSRRALGHFQFQFHQPVPDDIFLAFQFAVHTQTQQISCVRWRVRSGVCGVFGRVCGAC